MKVYIKVSRNQHKAEGGTYREKLVLCEKCVPIVTSEKWMEAKAHSETVADDFQCERCGR